MMKSPFEATRTFPEFNRIFLVDVEEATQFTKNGQGVSLKRMQFAIKNFLRPWMESVMMIILICFLCMQAWLMLHLIVNNSASVLETNAV